MPYKYNPFTRKLDYVPSISEIEDIVRGVAGAGMQYSEVSTFADLPVASENAGRICVVKAATGVWLVNKKRQGLYRSNGTSWDRLGKILVAGAGSPTPGFVPSNPPVGMHVVTNLFIHPITGELEVEFNDTPTQ